MPECYQPHEDGTMFVLIISINFIAFLFLYERPHSWLSRWAFTNWALPYVKYCIIIRIAELINVVIDYHCRTVYICFSGSDASTWVPSPSHESLNMDILAHINKFSLGISSPLSLTVAIEAWRFCVSLLSEFDESLCETAVAWLAWAMRRVFVTLLSLILPATTLWVSDSLYW